ncbi:Glycine betaine methyltransferase [anaerobic digester metagenome]
MKKYRNYVSQEMMEKIHEQSLRVLKEVGVRFENQRALDLFKDNGVKVDGSVVYLDEKTVVNAMKIAPSSFELSSNTKGNLVIGNESRITMPSGGPVYITENSKIRKTVNDDIINILKLNSTSTEIGYQYIDFLPNDAHFTNDQKIYSSQALLLKYSRQPACIDPNTFFTENSLIYDATKKSIEIIRNFEGIDNHDLHVNSFCVNSISPLCYDFAPLEKMFAFCEENQPLWLSPCAMPALTGPSSVFGTLVMTNAEILAINALAQLIRPGVPVIYGNTSAATNLKTILISFGAPETMLMCYATAAMADYYNVPCRTGGAQSDAKDTDYQAGAESMFMMQTSMECGTDLIFHSNGMMGSMNLYSYEKFILDEECIAFARRMVAGIDDADNKVCFDEIKKVGPRGSFLTGRTPKMYREEFYLPKYFNKQDSNVWQNEGSISILEVARNAVKERIDSYVPPNITKEQQELLKPYLPNQYEDRI